MLAKSKVLHVVKSLKNLRFFMFAELCSATEKIENFCMSAKTKFLHAMHFLNPKIENFGGYFNGRGNCNTQSKGRLW